MTSPAKPFLREATAWTTVRRACGVASVVAPVLLVANHSDLVLAKPLSLELLRRPAINFVVPYVVSSSSSARAAAPACRCV